MRKGKMPKVQVQKFNLPDAPSAQDQSLLKVISSKEEEKEEVIQPKFVPAQNPKNFPQLFSEKCSTKCNSEIGTEDMKAS